MADAMPLWAMWVLGLLVVAVVIKAATNIILLVAAVVVNMKKNALKQAARAGSECLALKLGTRMSGALKSRNYCRLFSTRFQYLTADLLH
jgi:hypothetical protein